MCVKLTGSLAHTGRLAPTCITRTSAEFAINLRKGK